MFCYRCGRLSVEYGEAVEEKKGWKIISGSVSACFRARTSSIDCVMRILTRRVNFFLLAITIPRTVFWIHCFKQLNMEWKWAKMCKTFSPRWLTILCKTAWTGPWSFQVVLSRSVKNPIVDNGEKSFNVIISVSYIKTICCYYDRWHAIVRYFRWTPGTLTAALRWPAGYGDGSENVKKCDRLNRENNNFARVATPISTFRCRHCTKTTWKYT